MPHHRNKYRLIRILLLGSLIALLVYLFHPAVGSFSLVINGEPVAEPLARFAAIPTLFAVMFFTGILMLLAFFGVGLLIFAEAFLFVMLGIFVIAPYFWPILLIIFLVIALLSFGDSDAA